ncbi:winged helix DNA-binding domain-containing protein [Euzebya rosea]|uniref:winged helix DNA-binding domain-containing protein n=1 Tax=Euzebya rosea TaxID=2052804 RepID=UPI000D3EC066|nr:winged helix DNA-binding domain-containing protein [Euzebya rosea]
MGGQRHVDDDERRARLVDRHHLGRTAADIEGCVADLVMLHSSDPTTPFLSLWARVPDVTRSDITDALYDRRSLWRLHTIRRTIWVVPRTFGPTALGGGTVPVAAADRRKLLAFVTASDVHPDPEGWLAGLAEEVLRVLDGAAPMTTAELGQAIPELRTPITLGSGKWVQQQPVGSRLLYLMAMDGLIVRGRPLGSWRASQYRWSRTEQWFDEPLDGLLAAPEVSARADLLRAYLARFGPATTDDIRWWTGWTKRSAVAALDDVAAVVVSLDGGAEGWLLPEDVRPAPAVDRPVVTLLPAMDPTPMGWKERGWYLGEWAVFGGPLFDRNGNVGPTVWLDGRVVGGWAQQADGRVVTRLLADIGHDGSDAVAVEAERLTTWLRGHVVIPRFRTPLEKEMALG